MANASTGGADEVAGLLRLSQTGVALLPAGVGWGKTAYRDNRYDREAIYDNQEYP